MLGPKKPKCIVLVAETSCCGLKIVQVDPVGHPCHGRMESDPHGKDAYVNCTIVRVWEFTAKRLHVVKAQVEKW